MLSSIHKYPIAAFYILVLILGTSIIFLVFQGVLPAELALSSQFSASIAGIIMTAILDGKAGLKLLIKRLFIWRVRIRYWLFAILFLVPVIFMGSLFNPFFNGSPVSKAELPLPSRLSLTSIRVSRVSRLISALRSIKQILNVNGVHCPEGRGEKPGR